MSDTSATIIAASLSSEELEKSIDKLVGNVATATDLIRKDFDDMANHIKQSLNSLGNIKIDFGGTADGGSSRRTSKQKEEETQVKATTQAYKEQAATFDQQAAARKRAAGSSKTSLKKEIDDTSNSYANLIQQLQRIQAKFDVSPIQNLRMRQHELEAGMKTASNEAAKAKKDVDELNASIANYRRTLETLPNNKQGFANRQAIQKEINDLITLRDVSSAEQQKWENAARQLASEYEIVKAEIRQIGQLLVGAEESEKKTTTELEKQLQKIREIDGVKSAKSVYEKVSTMPTDNIDQAKEKLEALYALKEKVRNTPLLSKSAQNNLEVSIDNTKKKIEQIEFAARGTNQTKASIKELNDAVSLNIQKEQQRRREIQETGAAAQQTLRQITQSVGTQLELGTDKPIAGMRELETAIRQMRAAYFELNGEEKASPLGKALENDIKRAEMLSSVLQAHNKTLTGMSVGAQNPIDNSIGSYERLSNIVKTLTEEFRRMGREERNSAKGTDVIDKIQAINREIRDIQRTMNRPTSLKKALGLDESTLDHINDKMQALRAYKGGLKITDPQQLEEMKQVDAEISRLQKNYDKLMAKNQQMIGSNTALGRSWNYMKNRLAFYFSVGASTQFIKNLIEVRSQYEMNERALGILINSAERGTQIFNELSQMALVSPYTLIELSAAAKQLTAYDIAARDVVDTTRRLADMAAAVGIPIERLTYALGQIKAYGYLNSRDARMFANAGIPLVKQLSEYYTELEGRLISTADVYDRIKKKSIDYNEVMEVMYKMTDQGGKFFDFQAKMADTLKVRLANLTLAWNNMLNDMGKDTQGVLTWGIGALRDMFNQWRVLDRAIKDVAWIVGIRTGIALASYSIQKFIALLKGTQSQMALSEVFGKRLANVIRTLGKAMLSLAKNPLTWVGVVAIGLYQMEQAILGANEAQIALNKSIRDGAKDNYDNITKFLEQYKRVRESLYTTQKVAIGNMYDPATGKASATAYVEQSVEQDIDKNEAKKAWEAIREQIELTTRSSDQYIGKLLEISNMSERVRQGFNMLDDIRVVNAALKELDEDTIKVEKDMSAWWNAYQMPDGLIGNIKDYQKALDDVIEKFGSLERLLSDVHVGGDNWGDFNDYQTALERLQSSVKTTTDSIINFIELKGWSGDINKINEVFKQIADKIALDNQLDPQKAFVLQTQVEEARSQAAKQALLQRINDEKAALAQTSEENQRKAIIDSINANVTEYNNWNDYNGRKKTEWERFTKWLKEQHISETTAMFRNMDAEDIKSLNFQEGKYGEYVTRMVEMYAKEHKMSYDEAFNYLKGWVTNANKWSVFIPLVISTEDKKSVYDQLGEYDKAIDAADSEIERLTTRIDELRKKKKLDKDETNELVRAEQELADAQKAKADAEAKGGHGKKEKKDERATQKAQKQAESELQKALKEELSIIDKIRSNYQALTKDGMSHADAIKASTAGYEKSAKSINQTLAKFGLQAFDPSAFAGISDPNDLVKLLEDQLNKLIRSGKAKPAEIKDLEVKINDVKLDAEKFNLTRITKGLNNELDKLKDEYELAVELDANPELGDMFADMFGIDTSGFTRSIDDYMFKVQSEFEKARKELGYGITIDIFKANDDEWKKWGEWVGLSGEALDNFKSRFVSAQDVAKKWAQDIVKQAQDLRYKLADNNGKIAIEEEKLANLRNKLAQETNDAQKELLRLQIQDQEQAIAKLKESLLQELSAYKNLFGGIAEHSAVMTRKLAKQYKTILDNAKKDAAGNFVITDGESQVTLSESTYYKEVKRVNDELRKSQSSIKAIKEAFTKGDDEVVDFWKGVELIADEMEKVASLANTIGDIAEYFGNPNEYNATAEAMRDISQSISGVAESAKGVGQIASGDYIGGVASVISGVWNAVSGWLDNSDKKIQQNIKDSERAVKRLELAYVDLQQAVDKAYGTAVIGAKQATLANKELQLAELQRQIQLEKSRESKNRDEDRILDLQKQYKELFYEIQNGYTEIVDDLMGTDVASFAENLVSSMIDAFKQGEDYMDVFNKKFDEMIDNMIMKSIISRVVSQYLNQIWDSIDQRINDRSQEERNEYIKAQSNAERVRGMSDEELKREMVMQRTDNFLDLVDMWNTITDKDIEEYRKAVAAEEKAAKERLDAASEFTGSDVDYIMGQITEVMPELGQKLKDILGEYYKFGESSEAQLSGLQQGIQGITETTAGALEAYMNGVSQQVYLQSEYLRQICEVMTFDEDPMDDVKVASLSQILLQLRSSYEIQNAIHSLLNGWSSDDMRSIRVEMVE